MDIIKITFILISRQITKISKIIITQVSNIIKIIAYNNKCNIKFKNDNW